MIVTIIISKLKLKGIKMKQISHISHSKITVKIVIKYMLPIWEQNINIYNY